MYGLPQAAHCSQKILNFTLTDGGHFKPTASDDCVYVTPKAQPGTDGYASTATHVDDAEVKGCDCLRRL